MSRRPTRLNRLGGAVMAAPVVGALFSHELGRVGRLAPQVGAPLDELYFVIRTAAASALASAAAAAAAAGAYAASVLMGPATGGEGAAHAAAAAAAAAAGILAAAALALPAAIPLLAPAALSARIAARASGTSAEMLAFLTLAGIVHTVDKTLFWTFESVASSRGVFSAIRSDAEIAMRLARGGGLDEVSALMALAQHHPHRRFRTFLQRYASLVGTTRARLASHVEQARDEALAAAVSAASSYAAAANGAFFAGVMAVAVLPMMLVGVAFLPGAGPAAAAGPLLAAIMLAPLAFLALPAFMPADSFLRDAGKVHAAAAAAAAAAAGIALAVAMSAGQWPGALPLAASAAAAAFGGANWALSAGRERDAAAADAEMPGLLDYIAEQRGSRPGVVPVLAEYAALPSTSPCVRRLLRGVASDAVVRTAREAFCSARSYPSATARFVLFVLHAIHEHGGGTRETVVSMAHSIRRMSEARRRLSEEIRFSAMLIVASPLILTFAIMSTSLMAMDPAGLQAGGQQASLSLQHGAQHGAGGTAAAAATLAAPLRGGAAGLADSLRPAVAMVGVCGGLAVCRIADYSFRRTRYLFLASSASTACLALWDAALGAVRSLV